MKKTYKTLNQICLFALVILTIAACEEDFTTLESDIDIGDNFSTDVVKYDIKAYTKSVNRVQTNNLPIPFIGSYNDGTYGVTNTSLISQLSPAATSLDPDFGNNVTLDSVVLTIPYISTLIGTDADGFSTYELDSTYGDSPFKLSIFRNNFFLRTEAINTDSDSELDQNLVYFSDGMTSEGSQINVVSDVQGDILYEDLNFIPSPDQIILKDEDDNTTLQIPALRIRLDSEFDDGNTNTTVHRDILNYWKPLIIDMEGQPELSNQNNFLDYFRGLYFKAEPNSNSDDGTVAALDLINGSLVFHYTSEITDLETGEVSNNSRTFNIDFFNNNVNLYENDFVINDGDNVNGDENLFLKGGQGSYALIDFFDEENANGSLEDFFNDFKDDNENANRLINDAFLKFYVDQSQISGEEPLKLYIYDIKNNISLIDYILDGTVNKDNHLQALETENGEGVSYRIRVTEYVNNILLRDSLNLQLGLVVSNNVSLEGFATSEFSIETSTSNSESEEFIASSSIIEPRGTVLFGSNSNIPEELRLQLEIFYTEPEN